MKLLLTSLIFIVTVLSSFSQEIISLAGEWKFQTDQADKGVTEQWFTKPLSETINLPGSMVENGKGDEVTLKTPWTASIYDSSWYFNPRLEKFRKPGNIKVPFWLQPNKYYVGAAWYQREIEIPKTWKGKRVVLYLERPHWESMVWIDNLPLGMQNSICVPHIYDLTNVMAAGKHRITIRIDNRSKDFNVGPDSHSISDQAQGNWNGIVGKLELQAGNTVFFDDIQVWPDVKSKSIKVQIKIKNALKKSVSGQLELAAESFNAIKKHRVKPLLSDFKIEKDETSLELNYAMGSEAMLWNEFDPALYLLTATLTDKSGTKTTQTVQFGMREFKVNGTQFEINGLPVFLRGNVDCCVYPLTGYAPMDEASWARVFRICRAYGLNHVRFHSWCPPEAAFIAADKAGFYMHVEGPSWANHGGASIGDGKPLDKYIYEETDRIVKAYGNHPSFCMMAYGNEPRGNYVPFLSKFVTYWKNKDNRRLYTHAAIGQSWKLIPENEYIVRSAPRGVNWDKQRPDASFTYQNKLEGATVPYITHEMGQWCVFPNFKEIPKYKGVFRAKNFELFQEDFNDHHLGNLSEQFLMASGKLQLLCYKAEIEAGLRTKGLAGFQLLQLNDFSGQGTALVGLLDAFWDEKGYVTPLEFTRFCSQTVPLAKLPKFVYTNNETFTCEVEIAHFGNKPFENVQPVWQITNETANVLAQGYLNKGNIPVGNCFAVGKIDFPLSVVEKAAKLTLEVAVGKHINSWEFWVYPATLPVENPAGIYFCNELDTKAEEVLKNGGKVFLQAAGKVESGKDVVQYFQPVFWNTSWFKMRPPHTTGIFCDPVHPAFNNFPTEYHSNYQWWEVLNRAQVMNIDAFPAGFEPLIYSIDTWFINRRLAMLFEAKVENGKLIVCSADLRSKSEERVAARQLLYSLTQYMQSDRFAPKYTLPLATVRKLFEKSEVKELDTHTKDAPDELKKK